MTTIERAVLDAMLSDDVPGVRAIRSRLDRLEVSGVCGCGCPSIHFAGEGREKGIQIASEATVTDSMDSVLLFTTATGELDSLEYVWLSEKPPAKFPALDRLRPVRNT
jgi:hypothetical protein